MATRKQAEVLLNLFERLWKQKYGKRYIGNRVSDQWGFRDIIDDLGYDTAKELVEYYFRLASKDHSRRWFIYNYDQVYETHEAVKADKEQQRRLLEQTRKAVEKYESD